MKSNRGFSLVEVMIVIIIVGILAFISFNMYRRYIKNAMMTEGKALLGAIIDAEEIHYSQSDNNSYFNTTNFVSNIAASVTGSSGINAATNKYFRTFKITGTNPITIQTKDTKGKITMQVVLSQTDKPVYSEVVN